MRHMLRGLLSLIIVARYCCPAAAAEQRWWWPFTRDRGQAMDMTGNSLAPQANGSVPGAQTTVRQPVSNVSQRRWMPESPLAKLRPSRIHLPEMSLPKLRMPGPLVGNEKPDDAAARNSWMQTNPQPSRFSPLQSAKNGAQRVRNGTRAAWHKTVDLVTPGDTSTPSPQVATGAARPSLLQRMFGQEVPQQQQQGPRTVTEWMAQDRLDP